MFSIGKLSVEQFIPRSTTPEIFKNGKVQLMYVKKLPEGQGLRLHGPLEKDGGYAQDAISRQMAKKDIHQDLLHATANAWNGDYLYVQYDPEAGQLKLAQEPPPVEAPASQEK